ncbi:MAG: DASH family cryptochrome [Cryomorphaceae bacterium]|nr:DASH family cryptochrome [Flavobacteriales bacterium]
MKTALVWFRNDLRTADHEALYRATENFDRVLPVYCIDENHLKESWLGIQKMGAKRMQFILESLDDLHKNLAKQGGGLLVVRGAPADVLPELCAEYGAEAVYAHKEATREERDEEEAVKKALDGRAEVKFYWGTTLTHINDLPFPHTELPDVFTAFRKKAEKQSEVRALFPAPESVHLPEGNRELGELPSLSDLGLGTEPIDPRAAIAFKGGESEAWKRLNHYFGETQKLAEYKHTRNGLLGLDYSSKFSAWLAHGCISPRSIFYEVETFEREVKKNQSTYWLVFELRWRDYFRFVAARFGDKLFYPGGIRDERPHIWRDDARIEAWKAGKTGIPFVDANMIELRETGFMSNRGRQNVASFFVKDLQQDWRIGAAWFEQQLIDYDVASNWANWAYVAGVGNDPRDDRYFNILTQAKRYDSKGEYVKHWLPELSHIRPEMVHTPWLLSKDEKKLTEIENTPYARPVMVPDRWKL